MANRKRGEPNEKKSEHTKEPETMCETTHRKAKKKTNETWISVIVIRKKGI
jgi:hypothetical protein